MAGFDVRRTIRGLDDGPAKLLCCIHDRVSETDRLAYCRIAADKCRLAIPALPQSVLGVAGPCSTGPAEEGKASSRINSAMAT